MARHEPKLHKFSRGDLNWVKGEGKQVENVSLYEYIRVGQHVFLGPIQILLVTMETDNLNWFTFVVKLKILSVKI